MSETRLREMMALLRLVMLVERSLCGVEESCGTYKAALLPRLIRDRTIVKTVVVATALAGTESFGWTAEIQVLKGRPLSRAN